MRVWIFNPFDDVPGEGKPQRYWTLAEELVAAGNEVVWWSSDWSHRRKGLFLDLCGTSDLKAHEVGRDNELVTDSYSESFLMWL